MLFDGKERNHTTARKALLSKLVYDIIFGKY